MKQKKKPSEILSAQTEQIVREYFESRSGWIVTKLDTGKQKAADFRLYDGNDYFLCEVKTVTSVRANKDSGRTKGTEKWFKEFIETMKRHFESLPVGNLSYILRLDSDDLYVPPRREVDTFLKWLENEIQLIHIGKPSKQWHVQKFLHGKYNIYSTRYPIHLPTYNNDAIAIYQLMLIGPREEGILEISGFGYGDLNLEAITSNVEDGVIQLQRSAARESDSQIPSFIVLAFESGLGFEYTRDSLSVHIAYLLTEHTDLSAIAILEKVPNGVPPPTSKDDFFAWILFGITTTWLTRFIVYHNEQLQNVKPLPRHVFEGKLSTQLPPA